MSDAPSCRSGFGKKGLAALPFLASKLIEQVQLSLMMRILIPVQLRQGRSEATPDRADIVDPQAVALQVPVEEAALPIPADAVAP